MILTLLEAAREGRPWSSGRVVVRGGALKGALRSALCAVLRGVPESADSRACAGPTPLGCGLADNEPAAHPACAVCRLFGAPGQEAAVWFGDALEVDDDAPPRARLQTSGLVPDRVGGSSSRRLGGWSSEAGPAVAVSAGRAGISGSSVSAWVALAPWGWLGSPDPDLSNLLAAAVRAVSVMGSLCGLDVEELRLEPLQSASPARALPAAEQPGVSGRVVYQLEASLQSAMRVGQRWDAQGPRIGGGMLRSACVSVLKRVAGGPLSEELFFGDLLPSGLAPVAPLSELVCSRVPRDHPSVDGLAARALGLGVDVHCGECGAPLVVVSDLGAPITRWSGLPWSVFGTRGAAAVRQSAVATIIPMGVRWRGSLTALTKEAAAQSQWLDGIEVNLGGGRSRGFGRARLVVSRKTLASRDERLAAVLDWDRRLASAAAAMALAGNGRGGAAPLAADDGTALSAGEMALPLVARSALMLSRLGSGVGQGVDVGVLLGEELAQTLEARLVASVMRSARLGGYHRERGLPRDARQVARAGSAMVVAIRRDRMTAGSQAAEALAERLEHLECEGVGLGRIQGLGRLELL